jgi:tetratricopeptide (TPR) repeat protein
MNEGRLKEADAHFEKALKQLGKMPILKAEIFRYKALLRSTEKRWKESQDLLHEARRLYSENQYQQGELVTLVQEGNLSLVNEDPQTAEKAFRELEKIAEASEEEMFLAVAWNSLALLARRRGDLKEALDLFRKAVEIFRPLGKWNDLTESLAQVAMAEAAVGHFQRAQERIEELKQFAEKFPRSLELAKEIFQYLRELKEGVLEPLDQPRPPDPLKIFWNQELALRFLNREGNDPSTIEEILKKIYEKLPLSLKVSFEERADYQKWVLKK